MKQLSVVSRKFTYWLKIVSLGMILGLGLQFAQAWTAPTAAPPTSSITGPITVGADSQVKSGGLGVGSLLVSGGAQFVGKNNCDLKTDVSGILSCGVDNVGGDNLGNHTATTNLAMGDFNINNAKSIYGRIFYDNDNAGYYVDPNGTSVLNGLNVAGNYATTNGNITTTNGTISGKQVCINGSCQGSWPSGGTTYTAGSGISITGGVISATGGADNLGNHTATTNLAMGDFNINNAKSIYGRIFYDNDNAGYYVDPNGTSFLNTVAVVGNYTTTNGNITTTNGKISGKQVCINGNCQGSWPSSGSGTVTSITAGSGLSGGTITGAGTIALNTAGISSCTGTNQNIVWDAANSRLKCDTDDGGDWTSVSNAPKGAVVAGCGPLITGLTNSCRCWGGATGGGSCFNRSGARSCPDGTTGYFSGGDIVYSFVCVKQ